MQNFTKTTSLFALGVGLAFITPSDMPTVNNNYSIWAEAEAANIKRDRLKRRANGPWKVVMITQDEGDGESTASADIDITYMDELGNDTTTSKIINSPKVERVYFDWNPPSDFVGGTVSLGCTDCGDDGFSDVPIVLGFEGDWDGDNEDVGETTLTARAWRRSDGSYRFRLKGKPADVARYKFQGNGEAPSAGLTINGEPAEYKFTRETWRASLDIPMETALGPYRSDITIRDDQGVVLDREINTNVPEGETRDGIVIDSLRLSEANNGNLKLQAVALTDEMTQVPKFNGTVSDNSTFENLIVLNDIEPSLSEFQFGRTFNLIEPDNFSDMTYIASIELIDGSGDVQLANFDVTINAGEGLDDEPITGTFGAWNYALSISLLENFELPESDEGPDDVGLVRLAVSGTDIASVKRAVVRLVPDDGGSELDQAGDDGDPETVEPPFILAWHIWNEKGVSGIGGLDNEGSISYSAAVAALGDFDAPIGETDLAQGNANATGFVLKKKGDTHSKQKAKRAFAHFGRSRTKK